MVDRRKLREYYDGIHYGSDLILRRLDRKLSLADPWYQMIGDFLQTQEIDLDGRKILEVGAGMGGFCLALTAEGGDVTGVDLSISAITAARDIAAGHEIDRFARMPHYLVCDAAALPFEDESFELVICSETLEHTFDLERSLRELTRVCASGGLVIITVPNSLLRLPIDALWLLIGTAQPQELLNYYKVRDAIEDQGFRIVEEQGTNFVSDLLLRELFPERWIPIGRAMDALLRPWLSRLPWVWRIAAGTVGYVVDKNRRVEA